MGLWDKLKGEFIDIVEWLDPSNDIMVHRFERYNNEIKNGAKLTVRESQVAVFINEGQIADVFQPGMYQLTTQNLPILATLKGWKYGFNSPFKAEVYFVNTKQFTDQKWGTPNPVMLRDPEFGPIRIRANGNYALKVKDAPTFIRTVVGTDGNFTTEGIANQLRNIIVTRFTDAIGESKIPVLDMASNYDELSLFIDKKIKPEFEEYGVELMKFLVASITLPPNVEEALDKRSSMGIIGDLGKYTQFQTAEAIHAAATNPAGGGATEGMGMGMGFAMAGQMMNTMQQAQQQSQQKPPQQAGPVPPPIPGAVKFYLAVGGQSQGPYDFTALKQMVMQNQFTKESLVWKEGMANWLQAGQVAELNPVFASVPPPVPPVPPSE
ncbi:MAG: SPFH domain-containing protein [Bacteroidia bacterium]|nr:SPFH domain-containing protein [Bacteroidia bacterium]